MAQLLNLNIKVNKNKVTIEWSPSSNSKTIINTTIKQLQKHYVLNIEDLSPQIVRDIVSDNILNKYTISNFDSKVITRTNKKNTYKFQVEDNLVLITEQSTKKEIFCPLNQIRNFNTFSAHDFEEILSKKQKITPVRSNIQTNELDFNIFE